MTEGLVEIITEHRISGNSNAQTLCGIVFNLVAFISHRFPKTRDSGLILGGEQLFRFFENSPNTTAD